MTGWVNYEQKEYAIASDADRRCVYLYRYAGEKLTRYWQVLVALFAVMLLFYCLGSVIRLLLDRFDRQNEEKAKQEQEEKRRLYKRKKLLGHRKTQRRRV